MDLSLVQIIIDLGSAVIASDAPLPFLHIQIEKGELLSTHVAGQSKWHICLPGDKNATCGIRIKGKGPITKALRQLREMPPHLSPT